MALHPTLAELERALLSYTAPVLRGGIKEWRAMHFFAPYAVKSPQLFSREMVEFLLRPCPSFHTEREAFQSRLSWKAGHKGALWHKDETFAHYLDRLQSLVHRSSPPPVLKAREAASPIEVKHPVDAIKEETKLRTKRNIEEMTVLRDEAEALSSCLNQQVTKAFPLRQEVSEAVFELKNAKEAALTLLLDIENALSGYCEVMAPCSSDEQAQQYLCRAEQASAEFRRRLVDLRTREEEICSRIEEQRTALFKRLQDLSRALDRVPMLTSAHPFRVHQTRILRQARDRIKQFRIAITKGPGPEMPIDHLERDVETAGRLVKAFYDEGREIDVIKERLHQLEHRIHERLKEERHVSRTLVLQELLTEVVGLRTTLDIAADRNDRLRRIDQEVNELEVHGP